MSLYIVGTPIGNLADLTYRAGKTLTEVDLILAEDTRTSRKLLDHYQISTPVIAYHDFNKERVTPHLITRLKDGETMALITDAGTPGVADPAFNLVRSAIQEHIPVISIPGPSAFLTALVASGLPTDRFTFESFLPKKSAQRRRLFASLVDEPRTMIFYETPHRIIKVLTELDEVLGDISVVIGRELTKMYEEYLRGTPRMLLDHFTQKKPRGELVILLNMRIRDSLESTTSSEDECDKDDTGMVDE